MDVLAFALCWAVVAFILAGYVLLLALVRLLKPRRVPADRLAADAPELPPMVVVVCVRDEAAIIESKLDDVFAQDYPADRLRVLVVDGGSTDATADLVEAFAAAHPSYRVELVRAGELGKIGQLNAALASLDPSEVVAVSDADAVIESRDGLRTAASILHFGGDVSLVGGWTTPQRRPGAVARAEDAYWDKQNRLRWMETVSYSASIVVAPLYVFRASLLRAFPEDCVADDIFVSFHTLGTGDRIVYTPDLRVTEIRQPQTLGELVGHKFRKSHAYITELLRVAHRLPHLRYRAKLLVLFKLLHVFALPWAAFGLVGWSLHFSAHGHRPTVVLAALAMVVLIVGASATMVPPTGLQRGGARPISILTSAFVFAIVNAVLIVSPFCFPFWRQTSNYRRLPSAGAEASTRSGSAERLPRLAS